MMYKNTCKLIFSNFHLVWKTLLYQIFASLVCVGLMFACSLPIVNVIKSNGVFSLISNSFNDFSNTFNIYKLFSDLILAVETFFNVILANISTLWLYIILLLFILIIVRTVISNYSHFATTNVLYNYLSCNIKVSYTANLTQNFWKNLKFQISYLFIQLPIDILIIYCAYVLFKWLLSVSGLILIAPIILIMLLVLVYSFKITLFSGWLPALIVFECSIFKALKRGFKAVFRRFYRSYSTVVALLATIIVFNVGCALCTFGASLFLTLPISSLAILIFNMVMFYCSQGMRFYVDNDNIVTTLKLEQTDAISMQKYII